MALTLLNVAYPLATVGPDSVGGAEQVVGLLERALDALGHRSLVVAREGSECAGTLFPIETVHGPLENHQHPAAQASCRDAIRRALACWPVDVVHLHGIDFHAYLPPPGVPTLVTLHLPISWYPPEALCVPRPDTYYHCVSTAQREMCPEGMNMLPSINNGVPVRALTARHGKRRFVVSLGRVCWEKGFHLALDAAEKARVPMLLGGEVFPYTQHEVYFRQTIAPRLNRSRRFIGPVGFRRKRRLLTAARALLVTSLVPETGSLVAMEALACGTPVIAFRRGALKDVVQHGVTGFLVDDVDQMADAIEAASKIDPEACRSAASLRFSEERMVADYIRVYQQLADSTRYGRAATQGRLWTAGGKAISAA